MTPKNLKSIIVAIVLLSIGTLMAVLDALMWKTPSSLIVSIGCSLLASGLVLLLTTVFIDYSKPNPLDEWKMSIIYDSRAEKTKATDSTLDKAKHQVDAIAFGLGNFRSRYGSKVEPFLRRGVDFRILTMDPDSQFVAQREIEENQVPGSIKHSIEELVAWADRINQGNNKGKIIIKGYSCMTLDFYWRVDNMIYVGPYWYGQPSNQTITYAFEEGGKGFSRYSDYFEELWEHKDLTRELTKKRSSRRKA
ncbi:MAG: hypothetical protein ACI4WX_00350 [Aristaeellaceae bacterium]